MPACIVLVAHLTLELLPSTECVLVSFSSLLLYLFQKMVLFWFTPTSHSFISTIADSCYVTRAAKKTIEEAMFIVLKVKVNLMFEGKKPIGYF